MSCSDYHASDQRPDFNNADPGHYLVLSGLDQCSVSSPLMSRRLLTPQYNGRNSDSDSLPRKDPRLVLTIYNSGEYLIHGVSHSKLMSSLLA
jgi:hypothetical protein